MRRFFLISFFAFLAVSGYAQMVKISGKAPGYVGRTIEFYRIEDYISEKQSLITSTRVENDSTFSVNFTTDDVQKVVIKSDNNRSFLYVEPDAKYTILFPDRNKYEPYKPSGNDVEISFYELDSTDINYKILGFQRWVDYFIGRTYHLRNSDETTEYAESFDRFRVNVENAYKADSSFNSEFLKTYIKYTIAGLDNIHNIAERNRFEKHDFYLKYNPVEYNNDIYMAYLKGFYKKIVPQLSNEANEAYYQGVLQSSPTLVMKALGKEYTLINVRIREIVMIQSLSEMYYSKDYPKTNIITILDSVSNHSLFDANAVIAKNIRERLTSLVPGGKAPEFVLSSEGMGTKTLSGFEGKHLYINFFDPKSKENMKELMLVKELNEKYSKYVKIISVYKDDGEIPEEHLKQLQEMNWDIYGISPSNSIWKKYQVETFPQYVFIDAAGYIVASPALGPVPNGEYETIDRSFFQLQKAWEFENKDGGEYYDRNH